MTVEHGEIVLETLSGRAWCFQAGDMLWLAGLPLSALRNRGDDPAILIATSRRL